MQLCGSLSILWHCLSFGLEWNLTFSNPVATAEFSRFAGILSCSTFTASSFRTWNSSTGIPSPPLALCVAMLPKAHLTSDSRMCGSWWTITPLWLSGSLSTFFLSSSVYSCHLFLISSVSIRSIAFLSFIVPIFVWNVPLVCLIFLERPLVFLSLLFSSMSLHWSLRKAFLLLFAILSNTEFWVVLISHYLQAISRSQSREQNSLVISLCWRDRMKFGDVKFLKICGGTHFSLFLYTISIVWTLFRGNCRGQMKKLVVSSSLNNCQSSDRTGSKFATSPAKKDLLMCTG